MVRAAPRRPGSALGGGPLDFSLTEDQRKFGDELVRFAERELNDDLLTRDAEGSFSREAWKSCATFGIQGLCVPKEYGGAGADPVTIAVSLEALGYGCRDAGLAFSLGAQMWSCELPIVRFGTEEQRQRYLPGLVAGDLIGVQAMTEAGSGSDAFSLQTRATRRDGSYVLNGAKTFVTNAPIADVFVIFARTDPELGVAGISAFLVDRSTPGLTVGQPFHKMGLRTSPMSDISLSDCEVPRESLVGPEGAGMAVFNVSIDWERGFILAPAVGIMQRQLERCIAYANERRQFDVPIGKFQAVSHKIADMKVRLETARLLLQRAAWLRSTGRPRPIESAMVKLYLSDCLVKSSLDTLQIHGGYGYMVETELERDVRDALASRIYSGTSEAQRNIIASYLGL